jgi:hypothetical protein
MVQGILITVGALVAAVTAPTRFGDLPERRVLPAALPAPSPGNRQGGLLTVAPSGCPGRSGRPRSQPAPIPAPSPTPAAHRHPSTAVPSPAPSRPGNRHEATQHDSPVPTTTPQDTNKINSRPDDQSHGPP